MEALFAKYPFLTDARQAVEDAAVDLPTVVSEEQPVVDRALDRVRCAIEDGTIGDAHRTPRIELLSYPIARVIVSLVDEPGLTRRYAHAEAETAYDRILEDVTADDTGSGLKSVEPARITLDALISEFNLEGKVSRVDAGFRMDVGAYLNLAAERSGDRWRLVNRALAEGVVPVTREEFFLLLQDAIRARVGADLPLDVPDAIGDELNDAVVEIRGRLGDHVPAREFDDIQPDLFPPCIQALLERVHTGAALPAHSQFTLTSFLTTVGMETDDILDHTVVGEDTDTRRYQIAHLRDGDNPATYPPPSCPTMVAYGDCVNKDALCERIAHPLEYYERRLAGDDPADYASREESQ